MNHFQTILHTLSQGRMIILTDGEDRENEGDIVCAASKISPEKVNFMAKFGRGLICTALSEERAEKLKLAPMVQENTSPFACAFTVSVDLKKGTTTGISAFDRAKTIAALAAERSRAEDFARPGHIFPLVARPGGVLVRRGHTEGSVDLMELAGLPRIAAMCEVMGDDGRMLRGKALQAFAKRHGLPIVSIARVAEEKRKKAPLVQKMVEAALPTAWGEFHITVFRSFSDGKEHVVLAKMPASSASSLPPLVRLHSECLTGEVFRSLRCDCEEQLTAALSRIAKEKCGVLVYLRQEGRGIGLVNKLKAYNVQDEGYDTFEANRVLGFKSDAREYGVAAEILRALGIDKIRLLTNNPAKLAELEAAGIRVEERLPLEVVRPRSDRQARYLASKKLYGHWISRR